MQNIGFPEICYSFFLQYYELYLKQQIIIKHFKLRQFLTKHNSIFAI